MQNVDSLLVFFLQLCLEALILYELESIHLELMQGVVLSTLRCELSGTHRSVADCRWENSRIAKSFLFLGQLPLPGELDVVFVEYYFLYVMRRHLPHEQCLAVAVLIPLNDLLLEAQELQDLLEHRRLDGSFLLLALGHL